MYGRHAVLMTRINVVVEAFVYRGMYNNSNRRFNRRREARDYSSS